MLIGFIKRNQPASVLLLPVVLIALWVVGFIHPSIPSTGHSAPLHRLVLAGLSGFPHALVIISFVLIFCEALLINYIIRKNEIIDTNSYLPALIYIVLMSLQPEMLSLHPILIANIFILYTLHKLMQSYRKETAYSEAFSMGIFISLAVLFYFPSIIFVLLIWIGLLIIRPFVWREWVISFTGFLLPWLYLIFYFFWNDKLEDLRYELLYYSLVTPVKSFNMNSFSIAEISQFALLLLTALLASGRLLHNLSGSTVWLRNNFRLLIYFSLLALLSVFLAPSYSIFFLSFLAIPFTVFISDYLLYAKRQWLAEIIFTLLLLSVFANQFFPSI
ncbi:MAG: hypothetical protein HY063_11985 [Bacteroidetes bacterium]|nr:hypothetical protein [Bacteroidota bacterium]